MTPELIRPILTVDIVLLTLIDERLHVVLHRREHAPHANALALIGGYVRPEEDATTAEAATRVLLAKAGTRARLLEQLMTFSGPTRDPRGWSASVAYYALAPNIAISPADRGSLEAIPLDLRSGTALPDLPFDHRAILEQAFSRWRRRAAYSTLPAFLLGETFTLPELRAVYEAVLGRTVNDSAFRRKVDELRLIEPEAGSLSRATARPAQLYRLRQPHLVEFDRTL